MFPSPARALNSVLAHELETTRFPYVRIRPYPLMSIVYHLKWVAFSRGSEKEFSSTMTYSA